MPRTSDPLRCRVSRTLPAACPAARFHQSPLLRHLLASLPHATRFRRRIAAYHRAESTAIFALVPAVAALPPLQQWKYHLYGDDRSPTEPLPMTASLAAAKAQLSRRRLSDVCAGFCLDVHFPPRP